MTQIQLHSLDLLDGDDFSLTTNVLESGCYVSDGNTTLLSVCLSDEDFDRLNRILEADPPAERMPQGDFRELLQRQADRCGLNLACMGWHQVQDRAVAELHGDNRTVCVDARALKFVTRSCVWNQVRMDANDPDAPVVFFLGATVVAALRRLPMPQEAGVSMESTQAA